MTRRDHLATDCVTGALPDELSSGDQCALWQVAWNTALEAYFDR